MNTDSFTLLLADGTRAVRRAGIVLALVAASCGDHRPLAAQACTPFDTHACLGPGACQGRQMCKADGTGWDTCDCGDGAGGSGGRNPEAGTGDLLVDDFEDGNAVSALGTQWYSFAGGKSTIATAESGPGNGSNHALKVDFALDKGDLTYDPYVGFGVNLDGGSVATDISGYASISFAHRGAAFSVRVETADVTDYDFYGFSTAASSDWKTITIPFTQLAQAGFGAKVAFDPSHAMAISFEMQDATGTKGSVEVDDLIIRRKVDKGPPNMTVMDPAPPADATIASVAITNPLQAIAVQTLDKGCAITNWLEQYRFESFKYDETYVSNVAKAGFKSLRLPIDLDLYITGRTGSGDSLALTLHSDLFTILDSFATWTAKYGIGLTIDYHQYDGSFDASSPSSVADVVALWGAVAEHFASNPRKDLFYELLNEPALASGTYVPTQAEWTTVAEKMLKAIRAKDTTHTVIFGDVQWYDIDYLAKREPLSDDNVIYAFHFYEPFLFTHQGASWANLSNVHDIPYPYAKDRWSEYSIDMGLSTESWLFAAARMYYTTGNKAALRNRIITVKQWAVSKNVPIICNEFGAYDATSRLEDRARYYTDLAAIFKELEVPWQIWFMIMNSSGTVPPEYVTALGLGK